MSVRPPSVDGWFAHAGLGSDAFHRQRRKSVFPDQLAGGAQDSPAGLVAPRAAAASSLLLLKLHLC